MMTEQQLRANKTDAGNGSNGICRMIDASRSPSPDPRRWAKKMKAMNNWVLVVASFLCGVFLSPSKEWAALFFAIGFATLVAFLVFTTSNRRRFGIALGLSSICAMAVSSLMFRTVPDAFPPYPPGLMDSLFPADRYPRSEKSFEAIDTRLHWYGLIASLPLTLGLVMIVSLIRQRNQNQRAQQDGDRKPNPAAS